MGCQKDIAKKVVEAKADYVFSLKGNQTTLHDDVRLYFESALDQPQLYNEILNHKTLEKGHGRIEKRYYYLTEEVSWLPQKSEWSDLKAIGAVRSIVEKSGKVSEEIRYFISSVTDVNVFANSVRSHWGIENCLHWCLDVNFREDFSRTRKDNSAENFAVIRHIALNILKQYPAKMSLARKRRKCQYDTEFMADVLLFAFA